MTTPLEETVVVESQGDVKVLPKNAEPGRQPPYHVVIWNDEVHTYDYVMEMLMKIFGYSAEKAFQITRDVDLKGKGIAFTTHKELAELKRDQILAEGPDWRMEMSEGPIRATIEAAPG